MKLKRIAQSIKVKHSFGINMGHLKEQVMSNRPQINKDLRAMVLGDTIENAVAGRTDKEGNEIPEGMPRWRWEMGKKRSIRQDKRYY